MDNFVDKEHYDKIRDELTKTFKKIVRYNVPIETVCNILNSVINKDIKNPKAVNIFYESFPTCQKLKNFDVYFLTGTDEHGIKIFDPIFSANG